MAKPIFKIKRKENQVPTTLTSGELAVDLATQKMYVGTATNAVPIASKIVHDGNFPVANNPHVPTQSAIKAYIAANYNTSPTYQPKFVCRMRLPLMSSSNLGGQTVTSGIDPSLFVITQQPSNFLSYGYDQNGQESGFYQTTANNMYLHVSYSVVYSPTNPNQTNYPAVETNIGHWRMFGIIVFEQNLGRYYYGIQQTPPVIGTASTSTNFTMLNGSAIIKLPKFIESTNNRWMLQFFNQSRSETPTMTVGNWPQLIGQSPNIIVNNNPDISDDYKIQVEIIKLFED